MTSLWAVDKTRPLLVLLTETYPYLGPDDPFLPGEVRQLATHFDVVVIPTMPPRDLRVQHDLPDGVTSPQGLILPHGISLWRVIRAAASRSCRSSTPASVRLSVSALLTYARRWQRAMDWKEWTSAVLLPFIAHRPCVVYSWWGFAPAFGVAQGLEGSGIPMLVRVHGSLTMWVLPISELRGPTPHLPHQVMECFA